jgi:hypothetical protein
MKNCFREAGHRPRGADCRFEANEAKRKSKKYKKGQSGNGANGEQAKRLLFLMFFHRFNGAGPRVSIGASFAMIEATVI